MFTCEEYSIDRLYFLPQLYVGCKIYLNLPKELGWIKFQQSSSKTSLNAVNLKFLIDMQWLIQNKLRENSPFHPLFGDFFTLQADIEFISLLGIVKLYMVY